MNFKITVRMIVLVPLISAMGCASTYKPLDPASFTYSRSFEIPDTLRINYLYKTQAMTGNKRYDKRERRHGMAAVAVKIENLTDTTIELTRNNFSVSSPTGNKTIYTPAAYSKKVKQWAAIHLLHTLWGPWAVSWQEDEYGETDVNFIFIPIGAIVGIGNAIRASKANGVNLENQERHKIWNKKIVPGSALYGLIAIPSATQNDSLFFQFNSSYRPRHRSPSDKPYALPKGPASLSHNFYILMNDGTPVTVDGKIEVSNDGYFIAANKLNPQEIIKPSDTKSLSRLTKDGRQLLGQPFENAWLFKVIDGPIDGYYYLAEEETQIISHLQKHDGPLIPFLPEVLEEMIGEDDDLIRLIRKQKFVEAINDYNKRYR
ncbi:MAG TPA: hypothetical protein VK658_26335 [Chryseolinea sp.]|nr:hypothetical protein [Chryseolinea sp.]